jgi:hypothetical protein
VLGGGLGEPSCDATCHLVNDLCEPAFQSIGYVLGPSADAADAYDFSENFSWDSQARVYRTTGASRLVRLPAGTAVPSGPTLLGFAAPPPVTGPWPVGAGAVLPDYPYLRADPLTGHGPFYEPCWDYACDAPNAAPPFALRPTRRAPLRLRATSANEDTFVAGAPAPWVLGRGKVRLVVAVAYAEVPLDEATLAPLFANDTAAIEAGTSFLAAVPWYAAQAQAHGLAAPLELEVVWSGKQVKIPDDQAPTTYDQCLNTSFRGLLAPAVALGENDILVQLYWGKAGISCANHVLRNERSFSLFGTPSFFPAQGLVVSFAHELMHLFGASDKYTDGLALDVDGVPHGCMFEGSPDYDAHDLMCHRVAQFDSAGNFGGFDNPPLPALTVAPLTAREIGWADLDGDGVVDVDSVNP